MAEMQTYIAWANDSNILGSSASGGIFQALAKYFLTGLSTDDVERTVYGSWQDNQRFEVKHLGVYKQEDVDLLIGSKYYQSRMEGIYPEIKKKLLNNQMILFSGTPCQVAGLKSYLKGSGVKEISKLLTIEVLCHGVSSRKVILHYLEWLEKKSGKKIKDLHFRTKKRRWYDKGSSMEIYYNDGSMRIMNRYADPFYLAFNHSMSLRPSCYSCRFAKIDRIADITIGDFWGAEKYIDDKQKLHNGIGLVMVNSDTGREFWEKAAGIITSFPADIQKAIPRNGAIIKPVKKPTSRQIFFDSLDMCEFNELIVKCFGRKRLMKIRIKGAIGEERIKQIKRTVFHRT
ncbi:MAG: Coenzyme F420 hydrogenase/dehydrogenase, beta subunit C-terminal domain [Oscillospiraceae bacterium]|nr:Coenzyme F420 hydrogenase/dehydrogenase, beta subunit C-terminal domain [Oscillospiraceae bacterium]